jgi:site-specific DNA recombinase
METAAVYARISDDSEGLELGTARQVKDSRERAGRDGRDVPDELVFTDDDISASTRSRAVRPEWDRLLAAVRDGRVGHVYAYSNSRLTRRPMEMEQLITLHESTGVVFHTVVSGQDDLSTADGRMVARIKASVDAAEAERIGERVARQKKQRAEDGMPQGGRYPTVGFTKDWAVDEPAAAKVREAYRRRASGESVSSIAVAVGIGHGTLVRVLANPVYCGLRRYKGEVVGELHPGFPRLVSREVWDACQGVGEAPPAGTNARRYLLSGIARCGACQGRMKGAPSKGRAARYRCAATYGGCGKTSIRTDWIDDPVLIAAVSREVFKRKAEKPASREATAAELTAEANAVKAEIAEVQAAVKAKTVTIGVALPLLGDAEERLRGVEKRQRQAAVRAVDPNWAYKDATEMFGMELGERRALIARHLTAVIIEPAPTRGRNQRDITRVVLHWTDGTEERLTNGVG